MTEGVIELTKKALHRLKVVEAVSEKRLTQAEEARQLGVKRRQVKRLAALYRRAGAASRVSHRLGQPSKERGQHHSATLRPSRSRRETSELGPLPLTRGP